MVKRQKLDHSGYDPVVILTQNGEVQSDVLSCNDIRPFRSFYTHKFQTGTLPYYNSTYSSDPYSSYIVTFDTGETFAGTSMCSVIIVAQSPTLIPFTESYLFDMTTNGNLTKLSSGANSLSAILHSYPYTVSTGTLKLRFLNTLHDSAVTCKILVTIIY